MDLMEFYDKVESHPDLTGEMVYDDKRNPPPQLIVRHTPTNTRITIPSTAVVKANWEIIEAVLTCKCEPEVLKHMSRVVGYFSRIDNWNKSKLGELKDRQKGNYKINEQDRPRDGASR